MSYYHQTSIHFRRVRGFMSMAKQDVPEKPIVPEERIRLLRARLILEEAIETINALGFDVMNRHETPAVISNALVDPKRNVILVPNAKQEEIKLDQIIDGCCDLSVVNTGTLVACGVPDILPLEVVDQNNLDKFGPGHSWDSFGKLIKPPGHNPPNLVAVVEYFEQISNKEKETI